MTDLNKLIECARQCQLGIDGEFNRVQSLARKSLEGLGDVSDEEVTDSNEKVEYYSRQFDNLTDEIMKKIS